MSPSSNSHIPFDLDSALLSSSLHTNHPEHYSTATSLPAHTYERYAFLRVHNDENGISSYIPNTASSQDMYSIGMGVPLTPLRPLTPGSLVFDSAQITFSLISGLESRAVF